MKICAIVWHRSRSRGHGHLDNSAALATVGGTLYGLDKSFKPFVYMQLLLPIFASAIVGGVGNPVGAIAGGYVIAFSELILTFAYKKVLLYLGQTI